MPNMYSERLAALQSRFDGWGVDMVLRSPRYRQASIRAKYCAPHDERAGVPDGVYRLGRPVPCYSVSVLCCSWMAGTKFRCGKRRMRGELRESRI